MLVDQKRTRWQHQLPEINKSVKCRDVADSRDNGMLNTNQNLLFLSMVLALCIISFLHIILFPLYNIEEKPINAKTFFNLDKSLCATNLYHKKRNIKKQRCLQYGIVTVNPGGRLGNKMWEYASVWALARKTGLEPYIPSCIHHQLQQIFESLTVPTILEIGHCPMHWNSFVRSLDAWNYTNQSIILKAYVQLPELVLTWVQDIIQEFKFKRKLVSKSQQVLRAVNAKSIHHPKGPTSTNSPSTNSSTIYVGVHVRRTDYITYLKKYNISAVTASFYLNAMKYYENKYGSSNVRFIIVSDDLKWCRQNIAAQKPNVYVPTTFSKIIPAQDLAIMAACNHSIIDYGSYGVWGAILAGGETVLYNASGLSSTKIAHLLPNWTIMD